VPIIPVLFVELYEPLLSQTVVSLVLETTNYNSFKTRLAELKKTFDELPG